MKNARNPERSIIIVIKIKISVSGIPINVFIATDEPVRVFEIRNRARKEKAIARTLIIPKRKRNCFLSIFEN